MLLLNHVFATTHAVLSTVPQCVSLAGINQVGHATYALTTPTRTHTVRDHASLALVEKCRERPLTRGELLCITTIKMTAESVSCKIMRASLQHGEHRFYRVSASTMLWHSHHEQIMAG
jgi:hypothetical protein